MDYEGSISRDRMLCARLVQPGDRVIVAAYVGLLPKEVARHAPRVVLLGERNSVQSVHEKCVTQP